jgi:hypothetical protein
MKSDHNQNLIHLANLVDTLKSNVERNIPLREVMRKAFPVSHCGKAGHQAIKEHYNSTIGTDEHSLMQSFEATWQAPQLTINLKVLREMGVKFIEE